MQENLDPPCNCDVQRTEAFEFQEATRIGGPTTLTLFPPLDQANLDEHSLFMQLQRALGQVIACKEAMWEELSIKIERDKASLRPYGWDDGDFNTVTSRQKFEALFAQYMK
jgi:hypothetical protein